MTPPNLPIFLIDSQSGDVVASFSDIRAAQGWMEYPDVEDNAFLVLDRLGFRADLGVMRWDVVIEGWSAEPEPGLLREVLTSFIKAQRQAVPEEADLQYLVRRADLLATEAELARTRPRVLVPVLRWFRARRQV